MNSSWRPPMPCKVGDSLKDVDTPALLVDMSKMEYNLSRMRESMAKYPGVEVRPHVKAHKCPPLAAMQVEFGAVGICCQTLVEAEAMVYGAGIKDVFLTNQVIGIPKLKRLASLAKHSTISVCVDDSDNANAMDSVAKSLGIKIGCVVEVNVGQDRCGVEPGQPAADLAEVVLACRHVYFKGIHCYQGLNQHIRKPTDKAAAVDLVVSKVKSTLEALSDRGIKCDYVTGGGTGTYVYEAKSRLYTEVQPGSYIFMDADYARNFGEDGRKFDEYRHSLFVLSAVQSVSLAGDRAVLDAGMKAVSLDSGPPVMVGNPEQIYTCGGDEHGILQPLGNLKVGDQVMLIPGHCDPTVNLYDWLIGFRNDKVEAMWPVLGRGPGV